MRTEAGFTHRQMARRLGVSHATYTRLENANQNVTLKTLTQLCGALNCDVLHAGYVVRDSGHRAERPVGPTRRQEEPGPALEPGGLRLYVSGGLPSRSPSRSRGDRDCRARRRGGARIPPSLGTEAARLRRLVPRDQ